GDGPEEASNEARPDRSRSHHPQGRASGPLDGQQEPETHGPTDDWPRWTGSNRHRIEQVVHLVLRKALALSMADVPASGQPLVDDPGVLPLAVFGIEGTEENVPVLAAAERQAHDGLTGLLEWAVAGEFPLAATTHVLHRTFRNSENFRIISGFSAAL